MDAKIAPQGVTIARDFTNGDRLRGLAGRKRDLAERHRTQISRLGPAVLASFLRQARQTRKLLLLKTGPWAGCSCRNGHRQDIRGPAGAEGNVVAIPRRRKTYDDMGHLPRRLAPQSCRLRRLGLRLRCKMKLIARDYTPRARLIKMPQSFQNLLLIKARPEAVLR